MTLGEYQTRTKTTAIYRDSMFELSENLRTRPLAQMTTQNMLSLLYASIGLANEAGEFLGQIKKWLRDDLGAESKERREKLSKELGDVLWYAAECANQLGLSLDLVASDNLAKLSARKEQGTLKGEGDNR